jgi:signal transduction histidine kinase
MEAFNGYTKRPDSGKAFAQDSGREADSLTREAPMDSSRSLDVQHRRPEPVRTASEPLTEENRARISLIAHDFTTQLTTIFGNADILNARALPGNGGELVAEILRAAEAAATLTQQLRAISRRE